MKVLFLHRNQPDYLADSLLHGLRTLLGAGCVDVPRCDALYRPLSDRLRGKLRGHGFTMYGLLPEMPELADARYFWRKDLGDYDLVVLADIWHQWDLLGELAAQVPRGKLAVLDGSDEAALFPYAFHLRRRPGAYFTPRTGFYYFKRELSGEGAYGFLARPLPGPVRRRVPVPRRARPISFSIPAEKIVDATAVTKDKDFPRHLVDPEVSAAVSGSFYSGTGQDQYVFTREQDYYADLRRSRFGVTTERAGWDALRHYELAANGCVLCFKDLDRKPASCAPHGLDNSNCIVYHDYAELRERLGSLTEERYQELARNTYRWVLANTTKARAREFLDACVGMGQPS